VAPGRLVADIEPIAELAGRLEAAQRPVIVAGPDAASGPDALAVLDWAHAAGIPVVADIGSGLRGHGRHPAFVASAAEGFLRTSAWAATAPDLVVRLGGAPTGKGILTWLDKHLAPTVYLQPDAEGRDHQAIAHLTIVGDVAKTARALARLAKPRAQGWVARWRAAEAAASRAIAAGPIPFEAAMVREAAAQLPPSGVLCLSNSLPIRHADTYLGAAEGLVVSVYRGANGIDGVSSMSLGMATGTGAPTLLVTGDLAFLHDLGGLAAAKQLDTPMVVLVINNDGGGIFSYLPIAQATEHFETLFGTPHGLGFDAAARLFGLPYARTTDGPGVAEAVARGLAAPGLSIVEVIANREQTAAEHRAFVGRLESALAEQPV
jgi:2-succinyl-5-enolpyruvyl-6-hydroxy-3-cyclohexene-1-carboxylate synthase